MWAQEDLPDLPGKATTVRICTNCHGVEMFAGNHKSSNDWDQTITTMTEKGLAINDADYATVLDYLTKAFGPVPQKVNVNKATSAEIQKALALSKKDADAIVDYRGKNGDFKDLDGLKKVDGLDAAVLDMKKAYILF